MTTSKKEALKARKESRMTASVERPLGVREAAPLGRDELQALQKLEAVHFPYLEEKLLKDRKLTATQLPEALLEFKRYFALVYLTREPLGMVSPLIDEVWHQLILFTREYSKFCDDTFGFYIHHRPNTSHTPVTKNCGKKLVHAYSQYFGDLPPIWGRLDKATCNSAPPSCGPGCEEEGSQAVVC